MRRAPVLILVLASALIGTWPTAASAAAPKSPAATGFEVEQATLSRRFGRFEVFLQAEAGTGLATVIVYDRPYANFYGSRRGKLEGKTVTADFGRRGSIRMTLEGPVRHARSCGHRSETSGAFKGDFEFHGEGGFLDFQVNSMRGQVEALSTCPGVHPRPAVDVEAGNEERSATLGASTKGPFPQESWAAVGIHSPQGRFTGSLSASREERQEGVLIDRVTSVKLGAGDFTWDLARGTASVQGLPGPFTGRASFRRKPRGGAPQVTGNLRVPTLGGPTLSLTGRLFKGKLTKEIPFDE